MALRTKIGEVITNLQSPKKSGRRSTSIGVKLLRGAGLSAPPPPPAAPAISPFVGGSRNNQGYGGGDGFGGGLACSGGGFGGGGFGGSDSFGT
jgi:hypothetical protein